MYATQSYKKDTLSAPDRGEVSGTALGQDGIVS